MMNPSRLYREQQILEKFFPGCCTFINGDDGDYLDIWVKSNSASHYCLRIMLDMFPERAPEMFLVHPKMLADNYGVELISLGANCAAKLLEPSKGFLQLAYNNAAVWSQDLTLYEVTLKGITWVNAYEGYRRSGIPIHHMISDQIFY
ncbi:MAG: hypothetical protein WCM76_15980 [Bacteroidota bacterium]